jgi:hypothetical protein
LYHVVLTPEERRELQRLTSTGRHAARTITHAHILLMSDEGPEGPALLDEQIQTALGAGLATIARLRQRCVEEGPLAALERRPTTRVYERALDARGEAELITLACSKAPDGRSDWSLSLLTDHMVLRGYPVSKSTVHRTLKKTKSSRG